MELQIKTVIKHHYTFVKIAIIQNTNNTSSGEDVENQELSFIPDSIIPYSNAK